MGTVAVEPANHLGESEHPEWSQHRGEQLILKAAKGQARQRQAEPVELKVNPREGLKRPFHRLGEGHNKRLSNATDTGKVVVVSIWRTRQMEDTRERMGGVRTSQSGKTRRES